MTAKNTIAHSLRSLAALVLAVSFILSGCTAAGTASGTATESTGAKTHDPYSSHDFRLFSPAILAGDGILHYNYAKLTKNAGSLSFTSSDSADDRDKPRLIGWPGYGERNDDLDVTPDHTSLFMNTTACGFAYADFPYMRIAYKTADVGGITFALGREPNEDAAVFTSETKPDGKAHTADAYMTAETVTAGIDNYVRIDFAAGTLDVLYIAFFPTDEARSAFSESEYKGCLSAEPEAVAYKQATDEVIASLLSDMDKLKQSIISSPNMDLSGVTGTVYYVSQSGSDRKDGKSPETAWKSVSKVNSADLQPGDAVCFERGGAWNGTYLELKSGVTYTAYGEGEKPRFSLYQNGGKPERWVQTDTPNVWQYVSAKGKYGNIVMNDGEAWGVKILTDGSGASCDMGFVSNGIESYEADNLVPDFDETKLTHNLEWWQNGTNQLFMYYDGGNPALAFADIKMLAEENHLMRAGGGVTDVTIDNLALEYAAMHGIRFNSGAFGSTVRYCTFKWIGGAGDRYGNAVEAWGTSDDFVIHDCYATDVFDCCYTIQYNESGSDGVKQIVTNVEIYNTIGEYSNDSIEFFLNDKDGAEYANVDCHNNYTANIGYGWSHQRINKDGNFSYLADSANTATEGMTIRDSVYIFAYTYGWLGAGSTARNIRGNRYVMAKDAWYAATAAGLTDFAGGYVHLPFTAETLRYITHRGTEAGSEFLWYDPASAPAALPKTVPSQGHPLYGIER